jgi:ketosteroid isomerase-like protein
MEPQDLHRAVEAAFNDGDVDALVALYEPDARMLRDDGTAAEGIEATGRSGPASPVSAATST